MSFISDFHTWDDVANYVENTLGIHYTQDPTGWVNAMKELNNGYKFVKVTNTVTGESTMQRVPDNMAVGVGEWYIGENTSSYTGSIGGAKSAPTAKSIVTNSSTQTAVITEEAVGVKDIGIVEGVKGINVLSGIMQVYGLIHTGIKIANAPVWKDMCNYVFDTNYTDETPLERVIDFLKTKIVNTITEINSDGELIVTIPDTIAQRMYQFMANHMIQDQTTGVYLDEGTLNVMDLYYNFLHRVWTYKQPSYTLDRYFSAGNPTTSYALTVIEPSDDLFKTTMQDFITCCIGANFLISNQVATACLSALEGTMLYMQEQTVDAVDNCDFCNIRCELARYGDPSKEVPVSLSEIAIEIDFYNTLDQVDITGSGDNRIVETNLNNYGMAPRNVVNEIYQAGDNVKYLKRGKTGDQGADYGYCFTVPYNTETPQTMPRYSLRISFPSNERYYTYSTGVVSFIGGLIMFVNGGAYPTAFDLSHQEIYVNVPNFGMTYGYSNLCYKGHGESYQPDDYLVTAGIRSKKDSSGNPQKHPDPTKTKEQQYPSMANKKQSATVQKDNQGNIVNNITDYVPTSVPFGSENANRLIDYGMNNDDPSSYKDPRPQEDIEEGQINTNDPIDGYNEDTDNAIEEYNDSDEDVDHFPDPIPPNEPDPIYPDDPPSDDDGENDDQPDPGIIEGVTASGMCSVYNPTKQQIINFSAWLWSPNFFDNFLKIFTNPMDAIISLHIFYATPSTTTPSNIIVGYLDSGVPAKVVNKQYTEVNCGYVDVPEYYGDATDYEPYTTIHCYLPFIGIVSLKANDIVGKRLYIKYGVDVLTGTCLASLTVKKGSSEITLYTFPGNCAVQIPLSGGTYAQVIRAIASMTVGVAGSVLTANPLPAIGGIIGGAMSASLDTQHSGTLGSNSGVMGVRKPYLIVTRKKAYNASGYGQFYGFPANKTTTLSQCNGFTRVKSVHIDSIARATDNEKTEIESLLKQGIIIK